MSEAMHRFLRRLRPIVALVVVSWPLHAQAPRWVVAPAGEHAVVEPDTTLDEITARFGAADVKPGTIELGEGETAEGTIVFANDPARRLEIIWRAPGRCASQVRVTAENESVTTGQWAVAPGIRLGTTLREVERLNGLPFTLTGFAYDYGGTIVDWRGGRLKDLQNAERRVFIRLEPASRQYSSPDYRQVIGDRDFSSGHPAMQRLNPRVYQIVVQFAERTGC